MVAMIPRIVAFCFSHTAGGASWGISLRRLTKVAISPTRSSRRGAFRQHYHSRERRRDICVDDAVLQVLIVIVLVWTLGRDPGPGSIVVLGPGITSLLLGFLLHPRTTR